MNSYSSTRLKHLPLWIAPLLLLAGVWQLGQGVYIEAKAALAQMLLQHAWEQAEAGDRSVRPWPWADTHPLARLQVARLGVDQIVLDGASGRVMAFGPGHVSGTTPLGNSGHPVISGHRDTHFSFLQQFREGDQIQMKLPNGRSLRYAVYEHRVYDESDLWLLQQQDMGLTLITCYPFDALVPGGPERYVVRARLL